MDKCRADKNWAYFYKIKGFKNWSYQEISTVKVVLLIHHFYLENLNFVIFVIWNKVVNCFLRRTPFYMLYLVSYRTLVYLELIIPVQELGTFNTSFGCFFTSLSKSIIRDQKFGFIYRTLSSWILHIYICEGFAFQSLSKWFSFKNSKYLTRVNVTYSSESFTWEKFIEKIRETDWCKV